jgi:hypothetical protein
MHTPPLVEVKPLLDGELRVPVHCPSLLHLVVASSQLVRGSGRLITAPPVACKQCVCVCVCVCVCARARVRTYF